MFIVVISFLYIIGEEVLFLMDRFERWSIVIVFEFRFDLSFGLFVLY